MNAFHNTHTSNIISLIITHNYQLRFLIMKLFNNSNIANNIDKCDEFQRYRWQNCCVLKLDLIPNDNASKKCKFILTLLHPGEIEKTEKKAYHYWSNKSSYLSLGSKYGSRTYHAMKEELMGNIDLHYSIKDKTTFYLMRHGQAKYYTVNCISENIKPNDKHLTNDAESRTSNL